ncbi:hypothetical protein ACIGEP_01625 [Microbacterium sp. NPDC077663]|uniref:hypothetical protein n=1 Tax=Microbacterium sp. NPDC077663 TaxID=3364189 RepID=UPI0037CC43E4
MTDTLTPPPLDDIAAPRSRRPGKRTLLASAAVLAALTLGAGGFWATGAFFTDEETVTGNSVSTGSLTIGETIKTPLTVSGMLPGQTADPAEVLTFENTGTTAFTYTVTLDNVAPGADAPAGLPGWIPVTITSGGQAATGTLAAPPEVTVASLAEDTAAAVTVEVGLSDDADNTAQGKSVTFDVAVTAEQIP